MLTSKLYKQLISIIQQGKSKFITTANNSSVNIYEIKHWCPLTNLTNEGIKNKGDMHILVSIFLFLI